MSNIIFWGTGKIASQLIGLIDDKVVLVVDNDEKKWGSNWQGYVIHEPDDIRKLKGGFDKVIIAAAGWKDIRRQLIQQFHIDESLIDNMYYRQRAALIEQYEYMEDGEKKDYISYLRNNPLEVFNNSFTEKYTAENVDAYFDDSKSLYYTYHNGRKMYFSKGFCTEGQAKAYYSYLCLEQDMESPHRYLTEKFKVSKGDVVLDAGAAEGIFTLDIIEYVDKAYLIEADKDWVEALKYTFEPYMDKVEIIEGFVGNNGLGEITIDSVIGDSRIDFIKMDIEGAELRALQGAEQTLRKNSIKMDICAYHNADDEARIKKFLKEIGYSATVSDGYMVFMDDNAKLVSPKLVRGLVRGYKE